MYDKADARPNVCCCRPLYQIQTHLKLLMSLFHYLNQVTMLLLKSSVEQFCHMNIIYFMVHSLGF